MPAIINKKGFTTDVENFNFQKIKLDDDYEGAVEATLIEYQKSNLKGIPVLYIHGFSDYFFHPHLAEKFYNQGFNFYALELRKYGNSILPNQHPNYCRDLREYFPEIDEALKKITDEHGEKAILIGHSNGGLISTLYTKLGSQKHLIQLLILNSPFLKLNLNPSIRFVMTPIVRLLSNFFPFGGIKNVVNSLYPKSLDKNFYGEWEINYNWKPIEGFSGYFHWLNAVLNAQKLVVSKADLSLPTLLLISTDSFIPKKWEDRIRKSDIILNIKDIKKAAKKIGQNTEITEIDSALHDVFLSKKEVREEAFKQMFDWLDKRVMSYEL